MAKLLERGQVGASFYNLYTLAKKMEACQPSRVHQGQGSSDNAYHDRYQRYTTPAGRVATLVDEEILPPDPEPLEQGVPEKFWCFICGAPDHFAWDCPHWDSFHMWQKEQLNTKGVGSQLKETNKPSQEVNAWVATMWGMSSMIGSGPTAHWRVQRPWYTFGWRIGRSMFWLIVAVR